jgi:hypothetical protein
MPNFKTSRRKIIPDINSMTGYCRDILEPQKAHLPLNNSHENMGMLCHGFRGVPHE